MNIFKKKPALTWSDARDIYGYEVMKIITNETTKAGIRYDDVDCDHPFFKAACNAVQAALVPKPIKPIVVIKIPIDFEVESAKRSFLELKKDYHLCFVASHEYESPSFEMITTTKTSEDLVAKLEEALT